MRKPITSELNLKFDLLHLNIETHKRHVFRSLHTKYHINYSFTTKPTYKFSNWKKQPKAVHMKILSHMTAPTTILHSYWSPTRPALPVALHSDKLFNKWFVAFSKLTKPMNQNSCPSTVTIFMYLSDAFSFNVTGLTELIFAKGIITCSR